jgi:hypothetical protein
MYTNNPNYTLYLYSYRHHGWINSFDNEEKLLTFFVRNYDAFFGRDNDVNLTWNDTKVIMSYTGTYTTVLRNYVLVDTDNRIINPEVYREKVDALIDGLPEDDLARLRRYERMGLTHMWRFWAHERSVNHDELKHGDVLHTCDTNYRFRCDPVPGIGRNRWKFRNWYRTPKTAAEHRDMANPENEPYIRKRRKQLPTSWDDVPKGYQRSWKRQSKKRKQWM